MPNNNLSNDINLTIESQSALKLEKRLSIDLNSVLTYIFESFSFTSSNYVSQLQDIKSKIYNEVYSIIRFYSQQAYVIGAQYATDKMKIKFYITHSDLDLIDQKTTEYTDRFFGRLEVTLQRSAVAFFKALFNNPRYKINMNDEDQVNFFSKRIEQSSAFIYASLATAIIMDNLNSATVNKTQRVMKITPKYSNNTKTRTLTASATDFTNPDVIRRLEESNIENDEIAEAIGITRFVFRTAEDDRVCMLCSVYDGTEFEIGDPFIPSIPDSTHFNCRCRLEVI